MTSTLFTGAKLVDEAGIRNGWVKTDADEITEIGAGEYGGSISEVEVVDLDGAFLSPGFIDLHCHGGGGGSYTNPDEISTALDFHESHGTLFSYLSLVSDTPENMRLQAEAIREAQKQDDRILGVHFEGPMISARKSGAHSKARLLNPEEFGINESIEFLSQADYVTIAPELPGALTVIKELSARGIRVAIGHTDCDYRTAIQAFEAGAISVTHLFNAMNPIHHRNPGPILAAKDFGEVIVELIADGHHLHESVVRASFKLFPQRVAIVTDAMSAAGCASGEYLLGELPVTVNGDTVTLKDSDTLAGSLLTLDSAFVKVIQFGIPFADAVAAFSTTPAKLTPKPDRIGKLDIGKSSRLLKIEEDLRLKKLI